MFGQKRHRRRYRLREELRALASAEHEKAKTVVLPGGRVGRCGSDQHRRAHRIAGDHGLGGISAAIFRQEPTCNGLDATGKPLVGAPHHGILFMNQRRNAHIARGIKRRQGWIATKPHNQFRFQAPEEFAGIEIALPE